MIKIEKVITENVPKIIEDCNQIGLDEEEFVVIVDGIEYTVLLKIKEKRVL